MYNALVAKKRHPCQKASVAVSINKQKRIKIGAVAFRQNQIKNGRSIVTKKAVLLSFLYANLKVLRLKT